MARPIQVPATLTGVSTLKDGGVTIRFATQELNAAEKSVVFEYLEKFGWLLFKETEHDESELELEAVRKDTGGKSPSQRMRNVLYLLYKQKGDTSTSFEQYYAQQTERIIDQLKDRLP